MNRSMFALLLLGAALALFVGCDEDEEESECPSCNGELAIIADSRGQAFDMVDCAITRHGVMVQSLELFVTDGLYATAVSLPIGSDYGVEINGYQDSVLTYTGSEFDITIEADWSTTSVVDLLKIYHVVGSYTALDYATRIAISGDNAYVIDEGGMQVIDISDPESPTAVSFFPSENINDLFIQGNYAYTAFANHTNWDSSGLKVLDISNPFSPVEVGFCLTGPHPYAVVASGNYAYLADLQYDFGLSVIDIALPENPVEVGRSQNSRANRGIAISGDYVFLSNDFDGFSVVNVANTTDPQVIYDGNFNWGRGIAVSDNRLYVSVFEEGLVLFDVSDPENPVQTGSCDVHSPNLEVIGNLAYLAAFEEGLRVVDVSDPASPFVAGFADFPGTAYDVAIAGNYAYVTSTEAGLQVVYIGE